MRCTHCHRTYTREAFDGLELVEKNGGRVVYGRETHEYRVCTCGSHVLLVITRPASRPSFHPMPVFAEMNHGRRR